MSKALWLLALALPIGCASVLGIDDVTVEEGTGGASATATTATDATGTTATSSATGMGGGGVGGAGVGGGCQDTDNDPLNCGVCGHDCLGGGCAGGKCQPLTLVAGLNHPNGIALDATTAYIAENGANAVRYFSKVDGSGGGLLATSTDGASEPYWIAVDDDGVYFTNIAFSGSPSVMTCAKTPPCNPVFLDNAAGSLRPSHIIIRDPYAYWTDPINATIERANKLTGAGKAVVTNVANNYDGAHFAWFDLDDTYVYWSSWYVGEIRRRALAGGSNDLLYASQSRPSALVVDGGFIFWSNIGTDNGQGEILTAPVAGGGTPTTLAAGQKYPLSIAVDESYVYWVEEGTFPGYTDGALRRCARTGCNALPEVLVSGLLDARGIAIDATAIYFSTWGDGKVQKLAK